MRPPCSMVLSGFSKKWNLKKEIDPSSDLCNNLTSLKKRVQRCFKFVHTVASGCWYPIGVPFTTNSYKLALWICCRDSSISFAVILIFLIHSFIPINRMISSKQPQGGHNSTVVEASAPTFGAWVRPLLCGWSWIWADGTGSILRGAESRKIRTVGTGEELQTSGKFPEEKDLICQQTK